MVNRFVLLEHTADIGVEAVSGNREGLAEQSGLALRRLLFGEAAAEPRLGPVPIAAAGNGDEETLVNWLNELLFTMVDRGVVPARIEVSHFGDGRIAGTLHGEQFDPQKFRMLREIKAVTHHQTRVDHQADHWTSVVYLDL